MLGLFPSELTNPKGHEDSKRNSVTPEMERVKQEDDQPGFWDTWGRSVIGPWVSHFFYLRLSFPTQLTSALEFCCELVGLCHLL